MPDHVSNKQLSEDEATLADQQRHEELLLISGSDGPVPAEPDDDAQYTYSA